MVNVMIDPDELRIHAYDVTLGRGRPPLIGEITEAMGCADIEVREALMQLSARHIVVLQPDGELLMVPPFSAVPTPFVVATDAFPAFVNCGWDALGAAVMLQRPTTISASCADCGQALHLASEGQTLTGDSLVLHFQRPARRWWESIVFT